MDMKTLYQAHLFAPAFVFQAFIESWAGLIDPRLSADRPAARPRADAPRIEVASAVRDAVAVAAQTLVVDERVLEAA